MALLRAKFSPRQFWLHTCNIQDLCSQSINLIEFFTQVWLLLAMAGHNRREGPLSINCCKPGSLVKIKPNEVRASYLAFDITMDLILLTSFAFDVDDLSLNPT